MKFETYNYAGESQPQLGQFENPLIFCVTGERPEARFILPADEMTLDRYQFVDNKLNEWKQEDPAVVGAAAFGSTTKGYSDIQTSDIDLTVFVDTDRLGLTLDPEVTTASVCWDDWTAFGNRSQLPMRYVNKAEEVLGAGDNPASYLPVNAQVFPISHEYLEISAEFEVRSAILLARYRELLETGQGNKIDEITDWANQSSDAETLAEVAYLMDALDAEPNLSKHRDVMTVRDFLNRAAHREKTEVANLRSAVFGANRLLSNLPVRLFGLSLSSDLQPYRQTFLNGIASSPEPDKVWSYFVERLAKFENSTKNPRDINKVNYPQSIDEAFEWYA